MLHDPHFWGSLAYTIQNDYKSAVRRVLLGGFENMLTHLILVLVLRRLIPEAQCDKG